MPDRAKVIKDLEDIQKHLDAGYSFPICWKSNLIRDAIVLLKEYKRQDGCPCTHCMEWECDEVCEEYKKWKDT